MSTLLIVAVTLNLISTVANTHGWLRLRKLNRERADAFEALAVTVNDCLDALETSR